MTMSDPIADMLTRIRNANTAKHDTVDVPASKMKLAIVQILLDEATPEEAATTVSSWPCADRICPPACITSRKAPG